MARADGVVIVSERYWAFARTDGTLDEGRMPQPPAVFRAIPLVRGLVRLGSSLSPLFRRTGIARPRERRFLAVAVTAPFLFFVLPHTVSLVAGFAVTLSLLGWMLRGRTLFLHGAEHRAIGAAEERRLARTWAGTVRPSRFSRRCGTNFAALVLPMTIAAERVWPLPGAVYTPVAVTLVSLALTMELWQLVQTSSRRAAHALLLPGLALQRLTTREPKLDETRLALTAVAAVLRREQCV
jgi:uncharacterized protein YqhQ